MNIFLILIKLGMAKVQSTLALVPGGWGLLCVTPHCEMLESLQSKNPLMKNISNLMRAFGVWTQLYELITLVHID